MKRLFSWGAIVLGHYALRVIAVVVLFILSYVFSLIGELGAFLKLVIILFGGSAMFGIIVTPFFYGIPLIITASEALSPSEKGTRYSVFGWMYALSSGIIVVLAFALGVVSSNSSTVFTNIIVMIYGICLIVSGRNRRKEYEETKKEELVKEAVKRMQAENTK